MRVEVFDIQVYDDEDSAAEHQCVQMRCAPHCLCLSLRAGGVAAGSEEFAALPDRCTEPAGCGAHNAAPGQGGLQECLHHLQCCFPADEQSAAKLSPHSTSTGSLPGGMHTGFILKQLERCENKKVCGNTLTCSCGTDEEKS